MYYQIQTQKAKYNLVEENGNIYIGGETFTCTEVVGSILYLDKDPTDIYSDWNAKDMMLALFYFHKVKHRNLCRIELTDTSSNLKVGNLSSYYIAFYEKTMYELNFNSYLKDSTVQYTYEQAKKIFNTKELSNEQFKNFLENTNISKNTTSFLMNLYIPAKTYREFFDNLKSRLKDFDEEAEDLIKPWLDRFIKINLRFKFIQDETWIIECSKNFFDDTGFSIREIDENNSLPKWRNDFISIRKKAYYLRQVGSGMRFLTERERECFTHPNWIGWKKYNINDYNDVDREYLEKLLEQFKLD
jgi:hypothetical protein